MTAENSARSTSAATLYIDGAWRAAALGREFDVFNPADGSVLGAASDGSASEARSAVDSAAAAFAWWSRTTAYERAAYLERAHALMLERAEDLAVLMTKEQGKPLKAARNEVRYAADFLSWFAEEAKRVYGATIPSSRADHRFMVMRQPVGVVAAITPWNYPVSMITRKVAPAIAAGCTIVLKPAEQTPLLRRRGLPGAARRRPARGRRQPGHHERPGAGRRRAAGQPGRPQADVHRVDRGRHDAGAPRPRTTVKRVSLELGGHAPFLVFGDADPRRAAKGARPGEIPQHRSGVHLPQPGVRPAGVGRRLPRRPRPAGERDEGRQRPRPGRHHRPADRRGRHDEDASARSTTPSTKGAKVLTGGERLTDGASPAAGSSPPPC